ncbi:DMT family transporter [Pedobacter sp. AW31-3R]|uniref:DMT family transporter n=1 Tax=Pedobacter sp. AW31-3R TaxID=3445781 RepID=UPI003F9F703A
MKQREITRPVNEHSGGWMNGCIGIVIFSGSLPATKLAVSAFHPLFLTVSRATIAGLLALCVLLFYREKRPKQQYLRSLIIVALGCVIGFPLLSAMALQYTTSAHGMVFMGLLPLVTAVFAVIRGGERPPQVFWFFSIAGSLLVVGYAIAQGLSSSPVGDILLLLAIIVCGLGYAEGAKLSKTMGGWQVISWALVLSLPMMGVLTFLLLPESFTEVSVTAWAGLAYISLFSMFIGFIFWYRGLAQGGIARIGQLQLLQPILGLVLATTFLHEAVTPGMMAITTGVILCVAGTKRFAR